jgi:hypothetical protein
MNAISKSAVVTSDVIPDVIPDVIEVSSPLSFRITAPARPKKPKPPSQSEFEKQLAQHSQELKQNELFSKRASVLGLISVIGPNLSARAARVIGLAERMRQQLVERDELCRRIESAATKVTIDRFLGTKFENRKNQVIVAIGPSQTGKTYSSIVAANELGWFHETTNLETLDDVKDLKKSIEGAKARKIPTVWCINELDKVLSKSNQTDGAYVAVINDILDSVTYFNGIVIITSNWPGKPYGTLDDNPFSSTIESFERIHNQVFPDIQACVSYLRDHFCDHSLNRIAQALCIIKPFSRDGFKKLAERYIGVVQDSYSPVNFKIVAEDSFLDFLVEEGVNPATQARTLESTVEESLTDIMTVAGSAALSHIRDAEDIIFSMGYDLESGDVLTTFSDASKDSTDNRSFRVRTPMQPSRTVIPYKIGALYSPDQIVAARHELGHMLASLFFGIPMNLAIFDPKVNSGNPVVLAQHIPNYHFTTRDELACALICCSSRALERVFLAGDENSMVDYLIKGTQRGYNKDIIQATAKIQGLFFDEALDPELPGTWRGGDGEFNISSDRTTGQEARIATFFMNAEAQLLKLFREAFSIDTYDEVARECLRRRVVNNEDFFDIMGIEYHNPSLPYHQPSIFDGSIRSIGKFDSVIAQSRVKFGNANMAAPEYLDNVLRACLDFSNLEEVAGKLYIPAQYS